MKPIFFIVSLFLLSTGLFAQGNSEWEELFNVKNLDGWEVKCLPKDGNKNFLKVNNGAIEVNSIGKPDHDYVWLMHKISYGDFDLQLKFQIFISDELFMRFKNIRIKE